MKNTVNEEFRCMLPKQRRKLMDGMIATMRQHFGFDENRYRRWEKEFEQLCLDHKTTLLHVVSVLGIDEWFVAFRRGYEPFEAFSAYILNHGPLAEQRRKTYEVWLKCLRSIAELYDGQPWDISEKDYWAFFDHFADGETPWDVFWSMTVVESSDMPSEDSIPDDQEPKDMAE